MSTTLPPLLASYVSSMNANDPMAFIANFSADAIVHDEGREHRGTVAIKTWLEEVHVKYQPRFEVTAVAQRDSETVLTGLTSGNFPGSPLELHHHLSIADGKIVALRIDA